MRKKDLVENIADKTGIHKVDVLAILESYFTYVKTSLIEGEQVFVRGFGSFILKKRAAKLGRNIRKGGSIPIPEHIIPAFKPALEFKTEVKESKHKPAAKKVRRVGANSKVK